MRLTFDFCLSCLWLTASKNFEMPGSKRVLTDSFIARRRHDNDLTEDQLFGYREDELPHIQAGTVDS